MNPSPNACAEGCTLGIEQPHTGACNAEAPYTPNPGIVNVLAWLHARGFRTCDSGDGATHECECDRAYPYVVITVEPLNMVGEADRLRDELRATGVSWLDHQRAAEHLLVSGEVACIQANYDPCGGLAFIDLSGLNDAKLAEAIAQGPMPKANNIDERIARTREGWCGTCGGKTLIPCSVADFPPIVDGKSAYADHVDQYEGFRCTFCGNTAAIGITSAEEVFDRITAEHPETPAADGGTVGRVAPA